MCTSEMSLPVIRTPANEQSRKVAPLRSALRKVAPRKASVEAYSAAIASFCRA